MKRTTGIEPAFSAWEAEVSRRQSLTKILVKPHLFLEQSIIIEVLTRRWHSSGCSINFAPKFRKMCRYGRQAPVGA